MNELQTFNHSMFGQLQVLIIDGKEHFRLNDVAWSLGYVKSNANGNRYLRQERIERVIQNAGISPCVHDGHRYISEDGLYEFIFEAQTEKSREFRKWVTSEVLPSIRRHGAYMTPETIEKALLNPDTIIRLATDLKHEREQREYLEQQRKIEEPYTNFGKAVSNSRASINVGAFAKMVYDETGIKMGRTKMFKWLRDRGYLIKHGREWNNPKQKYIEQGLFDTSVSVISHNTKGDVQHVTPLVTGKGQIKLTEKLLQEFSITT